MVKLSTLRKPTPDDQDLWPLTLADMMTLLLCFFLLILSASHLDITRYDEVADSLGKAMQKPVPGAARKETPPVPSPETIPVTPPRQAVVRARVERETKPRPDPVETEKTQTMDRLKKDLTARFADKAGQMETASTAESVSLSLRDAAFFDSGSAELKPAALPLLAEIASSIKDAAVKIAVEGHTDNMPIGSWLYPSNWELSAARASRVARFLIDHGVDKTRISVVGLADTRPLAPNADPVGRPLPENQARNRRVVIQIGS